MMGSHMAGQFTLSLKHFPTGITLKCFSAPTIANCGGLVDSIQACGTQGWGMASTLVFPQVHIIAGLETTVSTRTW